MAQIAVLIAVATWFMLYTSKEHPIVDKDRMFRYMRNVAFASAALALFYEGPSFAAAREIIMGVGVFTVAFIPLAYFVNKSNTKPFVW